MLSLFFSFQYESKCPYIEILTLLQKRNNTNFSVAFFTIWKGFCFRWKSLQKCGLNRFWNVKKVRSKCTNIHLTNLVHRSSSWNFCVTHFGPRIFKNNVCFSGTWVLRSYIYILIYGCLTYYFIVKRNNRIFVYNSSSITI